MNVADALLLCSAAPGARRLRVARHPEASWPATFAVTCGVASFFVFYFGLLLLFFTVRLASPSSCPHRALWYTLSVQHLVSWPCGDLLAKACAEKDENQRCLCAWVQFWGAMCALAIPSACSLDVQALFMFPIFMLGCICVAVCLAFLGVRYLARSLRRLWAYCDYAFSTFLLGHQVCALSPYPKPYPKPRPIQSC